MSKDPRGEIVRGRRKEKLSRGLMGMEMGDEVSLFFNLTPCPKERVCSFLSLDGLCVLALSSYIWSSN